MDKIDHDTQIRLSNIFMPYSSIRRDEMMKQKARFVHYTSAENALKIIQSKKLWLRNVKCMNDYMEVVHGHELLVKFFKDEKHRTSFFKALEPCGKDVALRALSIFDQWWHKINSNTFICSISEHDDTEDKYGRLSMWRAYGQQSTKAAIVINSPLETYKSNALNLMLIPTAYFDQNHLNRELTDIINNINKNIAFLSSQNSEVILNMVFAMLTVTTVSLKHEGFKEEREWRVIYLPELNPSKLLSRELEIINGLPQIIYKIPLEDNTTENVVGLSIPNLLEKIIIGPTVYTLPLYDAFKVALEEAGVSNPESRVIASGIPLRT